MYAVAAHFTYKIYDKTNTNVHLFIIQKILIFYRIACVLQNLWSACIHTHRDTDTHTHTHTHILV